MRIGIYGGTFDPVHLGHLLLAESCLEQAALDDILWLPAGVSPFKQEAPPVSGRQRAEMLELAVAGIPEFVVDRRELARTGPSYTIDTLQELAREHPQDELFLLLGADSIVDFARWKSPEEIVRLCTLVVVNRSLETPDWSRLDEVIGRAERERCLSVSMPAVGISASGLRQRVEQGKSIRFQTPRAVERYIVEHGLYLSRIDDSSSAP